MKKRNPIAVAVLSLVTLGIYAIYWFVKTKGEMNKLGAEIPTAWLIIVPLVNIWWLWKYSEGVGKVTNEKLSGVLAFILLFAIELVGIAIVQDSFNNNVAAAPTGPIIEGAPTATEPVTPTETTPEATAAPETAVASATEEPVTPTEPTTEPNEDVTAQAEPEEDEQQTPPPAAPAA